MAGMFFYFQIMLLFVMMIEDFLSVLSDVHGSEKNLKSVKFLDFLVFVVNLGSYEIVKPCSIIFQSIFCWTQDIATLSVRDIKYLDLAYSFCQEKIKCGFNEFVRLKY